MNKCEAVECIVRAKMKLEGGHVRVVHANSCHLEADPDGWACSCGAEKRAGPGRDVSGAIRELDAALNALMS